MAIHPEDKQDKVIVNSSFTGKAQNIDPKDYLENKGDILSGDITSANKATIIGGSDVIKTATTSYILGNDTIVGDATNLNATTFTGGADKITLQGMNHSGAKVIGDAISANGGTTRGGADVIIIEGDITDGTIIGDVESITNTNFTAGNDNIQLKDNVTDAFIYTDAKDYNGVNTLLGGNDIVTLGVKPPTGQEALTTVSSTQIHLGHGTNTLTAYSKLDSTGIHGGVGVDRLTLATMDNSTVFAGGGNDVITVATMNGGNANLYGQDGNDVITVTTGNGGGYIGGSGGNDTITIKNAITGTDISTQFAIWGGEGNDKITVATAQYADIDGDGGADSIVITTANDSSIDGLSGNDTIRVTTVNDSSIGSHSDTDNIIVITANNSSIDGGSGTDSIVVTTANNSSINGGSGTDNITVRDLFGEDASNHSELLGGSEADKINVTTSLYAEISGDAGDDNITVTYLRKSFVDGNAENDNIKVITSVASEIYGGDENDTITVTTLTEGSSLEGDAGDDKITVTTASLKSNIWGDDAGESVSGNDSITVSTLKESSAINGGGGNDSITVSTLTESTVHGGADDDKIIIANMNSKSSVNGDTGDDVITINRYNAGSINGGEGADYVKIVARGSGVSEQDVFTNIDLSTGQDTLELNWALNSAYAATSDTDGHGLITKGLGKDAHVTLGSGADSLTVNGTFAAGAQVDMGDGNDSFKVTAKAATVFDQDLVDALGTGNDTLDVNWAFNGNFSTEAEGGTLITKGLNANSVLAFGSANDGLIVNGALANRIIETKAGDDSVAITSTATNVHVDLGTGSDEFSIGSMGSRATLTYNNDGQDSVTIKGTFNHGMVIDANDDAAELSTGNDGGTITLDTLGTGQLAFGDDTDHITINKNIAGTAILKKQISTLGGNDNIDLKGSVTNAVVDAGTGADTVSIGTLSTGSELKYDADGVDSIIIKGVYNTSFAQTSVDGSIFHGLATGDNGGNITLDTLGTGTLKFGAAADTLTITKALSGSFALKDMFMQGGDDIVTLNTVNGAVINGGADNDTLSATGLGATGVLNGDAGEDTIHIGRIFTDVNTFKTTAIMSSGTIDGGDDADTIYIGNTYDANGDGNFAGSSEIKGTLSGGKVYGGDGDDIISTTTLSGSALVDGGSGADTVNLINMTGGSISEVEVINISANMSAGTINAASFQKIDIDGIFNSRASIDGGLFADTITINTMSGGIIHTNGGADSVSINTMNGGTLNSSIGDIIHISTMNGGIIQDSAEDSSGINIGTMNNGIVNGNAGADTINLTKTFTRGTINGGDGDDSITIETMNGGTVNAGEGDNSVTIKTLNGGSILGGTGDDTLILADGVTIGTGYSINLGGGNNIIQVNDDLSDQALTLGATHDNVVLGAAVIEAKINLGTGNDSIVNVVTIEDTIIDTGSGNDTLNFAQTNSGTHMYAGVGNDSVTITTATDTVIDLGTGNNEVEIDTASGTIIVGNSGNDNITVGTLSDGSSIFASTGNDTIDVNSVSADSIIKYDNRGLDVIKFDDYDDAGIENTYIPTSNAHLSTGTDGGTIELNSWTSGAITFGNGHDTFVLQNNMDLGKKLEFFSGNDRIEITGDLDGSITYDNRGQDTIILNEYDGENTDIQNTYASTSHAHLSTGTDGGTIGLNSWTSGAITFGNGNDKFVLTSGDIANNINFFNGNDSISISELSNTHIITYNNLGNDSITINGTYKGFGIVAQDGNLSTGANGGFIHVNDITTDGIGKIVFNTGNVNEHFSISTLRDTNNQGDINLGLGTDTITIGTIGKDGSANILYNNVGLDSITIFDEYSGSGVEAQDGTLSTGNDGGFIYVDSFADGIATGALSFGAGSDTFAVETLDVAAQIDLSSGNDNMHITDMNHANAHINLGLGNDSVNITTLTSGNIDAGDGTNVFKVGTVGVGGKLIGGTGVDNYDVNTVNGVIDAGNGNNKMVIGNANGTISSGTGVDNYDVNTVNGVIDAGNGNNKIVIENANGTILSGTGVDNITVTNMTGDTINAGLGNDVFNIESVTAGAVIGDADPAKQTINYTAGSVIGDADPAKQTINYTAGSDRFTLGSVQNGAFIIGDAKSATVTGTLKGGNDVIVVEGGITGSVDANVTIIGDMESVGDAKTFTAGNDNITIKGRIFSADIYTDAVTVDTNIISNGGADTLTLGVKGQNTFSVAWTDIDLGIGNDIFTAYNRLLEGSSIDGGDGNDSFTISAISGAGINGGEGDDLVTITTMNDGTVDGADGNDRITITTMNDGTVDGGKNNDNFKVITMDGGTVNGGDDDDNITITTMSGNSAVNADIGNDYIHVTTMNDGAVDGGAGDDTITIITMKDGSIGGGIDNDKITVTTGMGNDVDGNVAINGDAGSDTITMTTLNRGEVSGGIGNDVITVKNAYDATVYGDASAGSDTVGDSIKVTGFAQNVDIYGAGGNDIISVVTATNGTTINGDDGDDSITVTTLTHSEINTGADKDTVFVTTMNSGTINSGAGKDIISIGRQVTQEITISNDNDNTEVDADNLFLIGGVGNGANITLSGSDGFILAKSQHAITDVYTGITMTGGTINGTAGADTLHMASLSNGTVHSGSGADVFSIVSMSGGTIDGGTENDVITVSKAVTNGVINGGAGDDSISVKISGASKAILDGGEGKDVFEINATSKSSITIKEFVVGEDTLKINEDTVTVNSGDEFVIVNNVIVNFGTIREQGSLNKTSISNISIYGTNDANSMNVSGTATNSEIYGLDGADTIEVGTLINSSMYGEAGADSIKVTTINSGLIDGGDAADTIHIINRVNSAVTINNDDGQDSVYLENGIVAGGNVDLTGVGGFVVVKNSSNEAFSLASGTLNGSDGADIFHIDTMSSGSLTGGASADAFYIVTMNNGMVDGGTGADTFNIITMNAGTMNGAADADNINIATMNGGTVDGGAGVDTTTISNDINKTVRINNTGVESDIVYLEGDVIKGGNVILTSGAGFDVAANDTDGITLNGGMITGSNGADTIIVESMLSGTITGNAGADSIAITTMTSGTVDGGADADSITITNAINSTIAIKNTGTEKDTLTLSGGIENGAHIVLTSNAGFVVEGAMSDGKLSASAGADFITLTSMSGGTLLGGAGDDSIVITAMSGGTIDAGAGNDLVAVDAIKGTIHGGSGVDVLSITTTVDTDVSIGGGTGFEVYSFREMSDGSINGTEKADHIAIAFMHGGSLLGHAGNDELEVFSIYGGTIDGGVGTDTINIADTVIDAITIENSGTERDTLTLHNVGKDGIVNLASTAGFTVEVANLNDNAIINGSAGADSITITSVTDGAIDGKGGVDTIIIDTVETVIINNHHTDADYIFLTNGMEDGASLTFTGTQGNVVAKSAGSKGTYNGFDMHGGTIVGSTYNETFHINTMSDGTINTDSGGITSYTIAPDATWTVDPGNSQMYTHPTYGEIQLNTNGTYFYTPNPNISAQVDFDIPYTLVFTDGATYDGTLSLSADASNLGWQDGTVENYPTFNDTVNINTLQGGAINTGDGEDGITIKSMQGGSVDGGKGWDIITIEAKLAHEVTFKNTDTSVFATGDELMLTGGIGAGAIVNLESDVGFYVSKSINNSGKYNGFDMSGGILNGSDASNVIYLNTLSSGIVNGGKNSDIFSIINANGGTINTGNGVDVISISNAVKANFNANNGMDTIDSIFFTGGIVNGANINLGGDNGFVLARAYDFYNATYSGFNMSGGELNTTDGFNDTLYLATLSGGTINLGGGQDNVTIDSMTNGTINGGNGTETFIIGTMSKGLINGEYSVDTFNITTMNGGTLNGGESNDIFAITTMNNGVVNGGADKDTINIDTMNGGTVDGGASEDIINIANDINKVVRINNTGTERDIVYLGAELVKGGNVILSSDAGFIVAADDTSSGITVNGGTLTGSTGADTIFIDSMTSGTINAGDGDDSILFTAVGRIGGTINGGEGIDTLRIDTIDAILEIADLNDVVSNVDVFSFNELVANGVINGTNKNDTIEVSTMTDGSIQTGDGDDLILLGSIPADGSINGGAGQDTVLLQTVDEIVELQSVASISTDVEFFEFDEIVTNGLLKGSADADSIIVQTMSGGALDAGDGDDVIHIRNANGGSVNTGNGNDRIILSNIGDAGFMVNNSGHGTIDTILITDEVRSGTLNLAGNEGFILAASHNSQEDTYTGFSMSGGTLSGSGDFGTRYTIHMETFSGGNISTADGEDRIFIKTLNGGSIHTGNNLDVIIIDTLQSGFIDGGDSNGDTLKITNVNTTLDMDALTDNISFFRVSNLSNNGSFIGTAADEGFTIENMNGGSLNAGAGNDSISIKNFSDNGTVDGGAGHDQFYVDGDIDNTVNIGSLGSNIESFNFIHLAEGGTINGTDDDNIISVGSVSAGSILAGAGDDSLRVTISTESNNAMLLGGSGADTFNIYSNNNDASINMYDFEAGDTLIVNNADITAEALTALSNAAVAYTHNNVTINFMENIEVETMIENITTNALRSRISITDSTAGFDITSGVGSDFIMVENLEAGSTINSNAGSDSVYVGHMSGGTVNMGAGDDMCILYNIPTSGVINGGNGADTLLISASIDSRVELEALTDNVETFQFERTTKGGEIVGTVGNDTINVSLLNNIKLYGALGDDSIHIDIMQAKAEVHSGAGDNTISIRNLYEGSVFGDTGNDSIIIDTLYIADIEAGEGDDIITLNTLPSINATIDGGADTDTLFINTLINSRVEIATFAVTNVEKFGFDSLTSGGEIIGTANSDYIFLNNLPSGGTIDGGAGTDTLFIHASIDNRVEIGTLGTTNVKAFGFDSLTSGGEIVGTTESDYIILNNFPSGGTINGVDGTDTLFIDAAINSRVEVATFATNIDYFTFVGIEEGGEIIGTPSISQRLELHSMTGGSISGFNNVTIKTIPLGGSIEGVAGYWSQLTIDKDIDETVDLASLHNIATEFNIIQFSHLVEGGNIVGSADDESIRFTDVSGGSVNMGAGDDQVDVYNLPTGGVIDGGEGFDEFGLLWADINTSVKLNDLAINMESFSFNNMLTGGEIIGTADNDQIYMGDMAGGRISADAGNDSIHLYNAPTGGSINGGIGTDTVNFGYNINSRVELDTLTDNVESFIFKALVSSGEIIGTADNDQIYMGDMAGGSISAGAGDDTITVKINQSTINAQLFGNEGGDTFNITGSNNSQIIIGDFNKSDGDTLHINDVNVTEEASLSTGEFTYDGITIYFGS